MRRLETRAEKEKKSRRNMFLIGGILIVVMVFGTLAIAFVSRDRYDDQNIEKIEHNDITFYKRSGFWVFQINEQIFETRYNPLEIEDIKIMNYQKLGNYNNQILYTAGDKGDAYIELIKNLIPFIKRTQEACLPEEDCEGDFPIKNCSIDYVFIIKKPGDGETEKFYQEENCVFIIANYENQTRYADAFLFDILEIT